MMIILGNQVYLRWRGVLNFFLSIYFYHFRIWRQIYHNSFFSNVILSEHLRHCLRLIVHSLLISVNHLRFWQTCTSLIVHLYILLIHESVRVLVILALALIIIMLENIKLTVRCLVVSVEIVEKLNLILVLLKWLWFWFDSLLLLLMLTLNWLRSQQIELLRWLLY